MIFNLGTLTNGSFANLQFTVEPTNAGMLLFSASVGSSGVTDPNTTNNFASTNIAVTNYLSGPLGITTNSSQVYNPQNGLVEQSITVTNNSGGAIASARVVVTGLTNQLVNAVGTNSGNPFVYYSAALAANQTCVPAPAVLCPDSLAVRLFKFPVKRVRGAARRFSRTRFGGGEHESQHQPHRSADEWRHAD